MQLTMLLLRYSPVVICLSLAVWTAVQLFGQKPPVNAWGFLLPIVFIAMSYPFVAMATGSSSSGQGGQRGN